MRPVLMAALILLAVVIVIVVVACCKVSGKCAREEEREDPCHDCLRWDECNGVDDDCPRRN